MTRDKDDKKRRVIHTRVSEELEEELKERASALGVSVSNLVRNVLTNTLDLVEEIVTDSASIARRARAGVTDSGAGRAPPESQSTSDAPIIAWQRAVLNLNAICGACNDILPRGTDAAIGITDRSGDKPILCITCLERLNEPAQ